jgi:hypothetical protein
MNTLTTKPTTFECIAGIRSDRDNNKDLWIRSPRTGAIVTVPGGWFRELPDRLLARRPGARGAASSASLLLSWLPSRRWPIESKPTCRNGFRLDGGGGLTDG